MSFKTQFLHWNVYVLENVFIKWRQDLSTDTVARILMHFQNQFAGTCIKKKMKKKHNNHEHIFFIDQIFGICIKMWVKIMNVRLFYFYKIYCEKKSLLFISWDFKAKFLTFRHKRKIPKNNENVVFSGHFCRKHCLNVLFMHWCVRSASFFFCR